MRPCSSFPWWSGPAHTRNSLGPLLLALVLLGALLVTGPATAQKTVDEPEATYTSPNPELDGRFGGTDQGLDAVAGVGDADGDGTPDLLVGAPGESPGGTTDAGRAYLLSGASGDVLHTLVSPNPEKWDFFGAAVAGVGDADGDGTPDLLVGAPGESPGGTENAGRVYRFETYSAGETVSFPPAAPVRLTVSPNQGRVELTWSSGSGSSPAGYNVYRASSSFSDVSNATKLNSSPVPRPRFTDRDVTGGTQYIYRVTAVTTNGMQSEPSDPSTVTIPVQDRPPTRLLFNQIDASDFPTIRSYVAVSDTQGHSVSGLGTSNFTVAEEGVRQQPLTVETVGQTGRGISVALALDRSPSMDGTPIQNAKAAAKQFVDQLQPRDQGALISFSGDVTIDQPFVSDKEALKTALNAARGGSGTAFFDAVIESVDQTRLKKGRQAIVALTDGNDNQSNATLQQAIEAALQANIPVYTIGLGDLRPGPLRKIAEETGGMYFEAPTSSDLRQIYDQISQQLQNQYEITYTTRDTARDGTIRTVDITVTEQGRSASDTRTYQAPFGSGLTLTYNQIEVENFPTVSSYVSVTSGRGRPVTGLTEANFRVLERDTTQSPIEVEWLGGTTGGSSAISVALALDRSPSMVGAQIRDAKRAARTFVGQFRPGDEGAILGFTGDVSVNQAFVSDTSALYQAIGRTGVGTGTAFYDAVIAAVEQAKRQAGRTAVVALTDGADTRSRATLQQAIDTARTAGVPVYAVGLGSARMSALKKLARQTGGRAFEAPTSSDLVQIYNQISQQLQNQYRITYRTHDPARDGTERPVTITITTQGQSASDTRSYSAP